MNWNKTNVVRSAILLAGCAFLAFTAKAGTWICSWTGAAGDGEWSTPGNWSGRVPQADDDVRFTCGGTFRINAAGVNLHLVNFAVGTEDGSNPPMDVTLVGCTLDTAANVRIWAGSALTIDGGSFAFNGGSSVMIKVGSRLSVCNNGLLTAQKFIIDSNGSLTAENSRMVGRLSMEADALFRMGPGCEFKTKGDDPYFNAAAQFDITGGRYVVGRETTSKGWLLSLKFPNTYGLSDKFDEIVVEYPTGGEMEVLRPGLSTNANIGWVNETVFSLSGGTAEVSVTNQTLRTMPATPGMAREFSIATNAFAFLAKDWEGHLQFVARHVSIGEDATVVLANRDRFIAAYGSSAISPTAKVRLEVSESLLESGKTYPVLMGAPDAADLSPSQFSFDPSLSADSPWHVQCVGPYAYLTDGNPTAPTKAWTGAGGDANWSTTANWTSGQPKAPYEFDGGTNTCINVDVAVSGKAVRFYDCSAPFVLDSDNGKGLTFNRTMPTLSSTGCSVYSASRYPVVFRLPISMSVTDSADNCFTVCADGGIKAVDGSTELAEVGPGYVAFMDALTLGKRVFQYRGDVLIGGTATAGTLAPCVAVSRGTVLRVLKDASLTVGKQTNELSVVSSFAVEGGGTLTFAAGDGEFTYSTVENQHVVDGLLDIQVPFSGSTDIGFIGTGVVSVARIVAPDAGSSTVKLSGGVTFKPAAWETDQIMLAVPVGEEGVLEITADATGNHGNLIAIGRDAKLVKTGAGPLRFAAAATVDGALDIRAGQIELTGTLKTAAASGFADVLTAADIVGTIQIPENYRARIVEAANGAKTLRLKEKRGLVFVVR